MGNRGRPSLKISPEARLERRRAQLAESQRKCRARKRQSKKGGREATEIPTPEPSPESKYREIEQWSMDIGSSEMGDSFESSPRDTVRDDDEVVSGVSPASNPLPDNQAPEAHFAAHEIEQAVFVGGSMAEGSMTEHELGSPETELPWLLLAEGEGMSMTADDIDWKQFMGHSVQTEETDRTSPQDMDALDSSIGTWSPEDMFNMATPPDLSSHGNEVLSVNPTDAILHKGLPDFDFDLFDPVPAESWGSSFDWELYINNPAAPEQSINVDWFANNQNSEFTTDV